jgi:hypothetical protein
MPVVAQIVPSFILSVSAGLVVELPALPQTDLGSSPSAPRR